METLEGKEKDERRENMVTEKQKKGEKNMN